MWGTVQRCPATSTAVRKGRSWPADHWDSCALNNGRGRTRQLGTFKPPTPLMDA